MAEINFAYLDNAIEVMHGLLLQIDKTHDTASAATAVDGENAVDARSGSVGAKGGKLTRTTSETAYEDLESVYDDIGDLKVSEGKKTSTKSTKSIDLKNKTISLGKEHETELKGDEDCRTPQQMLGRLRIAATMAARGSSRRS